MNLDQARAISEALHHRDAIPGLEVRERPLMPFEAAEFLLVQAAELLPPSDEQVAAMDDTVSYAEAQQ